MKSVLELDSVVRRRKDLVATDIDQDKVFLDISSGKYYGLNRVGADIWELVEEPISIKALCDELVTRYDVEEAVCRKETLKFCQTLWEAGSLETQIGNPGD